MEKGLEINNLKLSSVDKENLRKRIVRMMKKHNEPKKVSEICECSISHVYTTWKKYNDCGIKALQAEKTGRKADSGALNLAQQKTIQGLLVDKNPEQLKLAGCLWNRENIAQLIKEQYGIKLTLQAISKYLKKWGFTPQRPIKTNYRQKPEAVKKWLKEEYPHIAERSKKEKAEIHWGDETGIQNESNYVRGYAPKGQTPTMPVNSQKLRVNIISSITNQGKLRFMFYRDSMTQQKFIEFMERLIKGVSQKIFFIVDNLKVHHGQLVKDWLAKKTDKIEIFYLPAYSPEYNPDEYLNGCLKREIAKKGFSKTKDELESKARSSMKSFQKRKGYIEKLFDAKSVKYAAK